MTARPKTHRRQFAAYVVAGIVSTICNLSSRYLFERAMPYELALVGANAVGILSAFLMNRLLVFGASSNESAWHELWRFTAVNLVGIVASWLVSVLLYRLVLPALGWHWHADLIAHAAGIAVPVIPNFLAHRHWTFRRDEGERQSMR